MTASNRSPGGPHQHRLPVRLATARLALWETWRGRHKPVTVHRILIAHHLLLGDTLLLTPLLAALRDHYPGADIVFCCPRPFLGLYSGRPYGVDALVYDPRDLASLRALRHRGPYDLALVPAEARHGWLARAVGARWIRGFHGDKRRYQWSLDEPLHYRTHPAPVSELMADLAQYPGSRRYDPRQWPPPLSPFAGPPPPYVVLHLGAGSPLKYWPASHWQSLAVNLDACGLRVVLSTGPGQENLAQAVDPQRQFHHYAGTLDLPALWHLLSGARLLVCPDTGVAHLAKLTLTPSVVLFGPGQAALFAPGSFWAQVPYRAVTLDDLPCRDQPRTFGHTVPWIRTCVRQPAECGYQGRCMTDLSTAQVWDAVAALLAPDHDVGQETLGGRGVPLPLAGSGPSVDRDKP